MKSIYTLLTIFLLTTIPTFAEEQSTNDIVLKMQHDLNLSQDQVANITEIIDRYVLASEDLQKSIDDGTMNASAIDAQRQQIKAVEDQGIAQYLRSDQLSEWNNIQGQEQKNSDANQGDGSADEYSNLPKGH